MRIIVARYRVVLNTQGYRSVACSKKTWEKGTINDFMRAINGWRTTESSLKEVKWRLSYFAGCTYTTDVWNSTLGCIDPKYEAWIKKRCNKIKYYDILCDMERVSSVQAPGMAQGYVDIDKEIGKLKENGVVRIPLKNFYDIRQNLYKRLNGCYIEITRI